MSIVTATVYSIATATNLKSALLRGKSTYKKYQSNWSNILDILEPVGEFRQIQLSLQNCVSTLSLPERRAILLLGTRIGSKKHTVGAL